ncbi:hypothetical protein GNZ12_43300 [Paraburkholderia sp. 1N]|uniref:Uncharacterized protein n=1 Tax=Paraburkholderia solitsugae TaxID=2675748 RepID=A0ABX2C7K6_9BURK|nr:hypothetical protein [Paraburkholderia solitsugae]NPT48000.1 hypothetical protein [Paraburkholderia solitsugae]
METLIEVGVAHIARMMGPSLVGSPYGRILPAQYWRWPLPQAPGPHLTRFRLCALDGLLLQLCAFEASVKSRPSVTGERTSGRSRTAVAKTLAGREAQGPLVPTEGFIGLTGQ